MTELAQGVRVPRKRSKRARPRPDAWAWVGIAIVAVGLFLALFGPLLAPYNVGQIVTGCSQRRTAPRCWAETCWAATC